MSDISDKRDGDAGLLEKLIKELWLKTKPGNEAQQLRAEISRSFDSPRFETGASDSLPDCAWDLIDVAIQRAFDLRDAALYEKDAEIVRLRASSAARVVEAARKLLANDLLPKSKPTISELEDILSRPAPNISLNPDGSLTANRIYDGLREALTEHDAAPDDGWRPIEAAPKDGTHFLAIGRLVADEYDEDDVIIHRHVTEINVYIAYWCFGAIVSFPFSGGIPINLTFTHWRPLPLLPPPAKEGKG